jgi:hypothetical protein
MAHAACGRPETGGYVYYRWNDAVFYQAYESLDPTQTLAVNPCLHQTNSPPLFSYAPVNGGEVDRFHPARGAALFKMKSRLGTVDAIDNGRYYNHSFWSNGSCSGPPPQPDDASYHGYVYLLAHQVRDLGGDLGWQDIVISFGFAHYPRTELWEAQWWSGDWGHVAFQNQWMTMIKNKFAGFGADTSPRSAFDMPDLNILCNP